MGHCWQLGRIKIFVFEGKKISTQKSLHAKVTQMTLLEYAGPVREHHFNLHSITAKSHTHNYIYDLQMKNKKRYKAKWFRGVAEGILMARNNELTLLFFSSLCSLNLGLYMRM